MGKGKGNFKRWCTIVYPGRVFIEHTNVSPKTYLKYVRKIKIKLKLQLNYIYIANSFLKKTFSTSSVKSNHGLFDIIKIRKNLFMTQKKFNSLIQF
jgi:hypothetical protein